MSAAEEKELGSQAWKNGDYSKAVEHFTKAIDLVPEKATQILLYSNRSAAYLKLKQNVLALSDANKCIELDQKWTKGYTRKGDALYAEKKYSEAYNAYNAGLRIDSKDATLVQKAEQAMNAIAAQPSASSGRGWGSGSQNSPWGGASPTSISLTSDLPGTLGTVQSYGRYFMLINCILYLLPFGTSFSMGSYRRALLAAIVGYVIALYGRLGIPKFSMEYGQRLLTDPSFMNLFLSSLLIMQRPYFLGLASLFLLELRYVSTLGFNYARNALPAVSGQLSALFARFAPAMAGQDLSAMFAPSMVNAFNSQITKMSALFEVGQGIFLVIELILPTRNIMFMFLWWQYLQMRYMVDSTGNVKAAFADADRRISYLVNHQMCPKMISKGYTFVKEKLAEQVQPPTGDSSGPSLLGKLSKCSIM